ncbi:MAG: threonylcarbamoyl-AMP synthase [Gammaproteobacteria bacterium]|nr:threonylcarbamoyl-AMP synthase [Gammaproteobacteria bacterium]
MTLTIKIHPTHPQARLLRRAVETLRNDGIIVYPTDSGYALGCMIGSKETTERIRRIRHLDEQHYFSLICRDLSEISVYAYVDNIRFRLLKANTPGPYTFILSATKEVPKRFLRPKRKTIGLRIPENKIAQMLLQELEAPLLSASLILPESDVLFSDVHEVEDLLQNKVDLIIDGGTCELLATTVVDLTGSTPEIIREGRGSTEPFL